MAELGDQHRRSQLDCCHSKPEGELTADEHGQIVCEELDKRAHNNDDRAYDGRPPPAQLVSEPAEE